MRRWTSRGFAIRGGFGFEKHKWDECGENAIRDYIANCSITVEMLKKLKWKYFNNVSLSYSFDDTDNLYQNFQYIDYNKANKIHNLQKLKKKYKNLNKRYEKRLSNLFFEIKKKDSEIIFITQIKYNGLENEKLYAN